MRKVIQQSVLLPRSAVELFDMYLDPKKHQAFTGAPVTIGPTPGSAFSAFDGVLTGSILTVVKSSLVVQSWRSAKFTSTDIDSTLILSFTSEQEKGRINLVHLDVPEHDFEGVAEGWQKYYWEPWLRYLEANK